jgi:hypothetical protein
MTSFEESLKAAIQGINASLEVVETDLHEVVTEAANGIQQVTNGVAQLVLVKTGESAEHVSYILQLVSTGNQPVQLLALTLTRRGYPIHTHSGPIQDKEGLKKIIAEMGTNPDSPLVVNLAFLLRKTKKPPA